MPPLAHGIGLTGLDHRYRSHVELLGTASIDLPQQTGISRSRSGHGHRTVSWHPAIDLDVQLYAVERELVQMREEDERLKKLDARFAELDARLDAIVFSSSTNRTDSCPRATGPRRDPLAR